MPNLLPVAFPFHLRLLFFDQVVDHILGDICRVFPGPPDTFHNIPRADRISGLLPDHEAVDLVAESLERPIDENKD
jgi:hypothetical protein